MINEPSDRTTYESSSRPMSEPSDRINNEPSDRPPITITEPQPEPAISSEVHAEDKVHVEEFRITGDSLVSKIKELIHEGNIRRIIIKNEEGRTLIEIPLTVGVVGGVIGAAAFPVVAAVGAIGALVAHLTIVIERKV